jgi:tRNA threonylcarbamoyladenosine biosynthesis protein TsaE
LNDEAATVEFGRRLGKRLLEDYGGSAVVFLYGDLGAGKTTLVRGILRQLGYSGAVKSPTYTLLEPYRVGDVDVYHFDLYRVADAQELEFVGFDDILDGPGLKLFEWPQRAVDWLPEAHVCVTLQVYPRPVPAAGETRTADTAYPEVVRKVDVSFF